MEEGYVANRDMAGIREVERLFARWRKRKRPGRLERIPAELWQRAVDLCGEHPTWRVAKVLRLSYAELKSRVAAAEEAGGEPSGFPDPRFVELVMPGRAGQPEVAGTWSLDVTDGSGRMLRLACQGPPCEPVCQLVRDLWGKP